MKNNKGFGKYEVMTMIVILLIVFAFIFYLVIQGAEKQKFTTMKENALNFAKTVATNTSSFHYIDVVYLDEVIEEGFSKNIHNPFGGGECDITQSRVDTKDGQTYATLKCGNYLIDQSDFTDLDKVPIYEVSDWQEESIEGEDVQERVLYNCIADGNEVFDQYFEELYFVYRYNKEFNESSYFIDLLPGGHCEIVSKTFYRTRTLVPLKK